MDNLRFGTTARKRAKRRQRTRRAILLVWALSALGVGGPVTLLHAIDGSAQGSGRPEASPVVADIAGGPIYLGRERADVEPEVAEEEKDPGKNKPREASSPADSVESIIRRAAAAHGVDGDYLISIAACESGLDPRAYNSAGYHGLFQYDEQTWAAYGKGSIWDPAAQAEATAMLIADGQSSRWPNCA